MKTISFSEEKLSLLDGIYIYLYPPAMKKIETILAQLIEFHQQCCDQGNKLKWIVTRRWKFFEEDEEETQSSLLKSKIKLVDVAKKDEKAVPFFIYQVV